MDFSQEQIDDLKILFETIDTDNDGALGLKELRTLLGEFEIDESFAPAMLRILTKSPNNDTRPGVKFKDILEFFSILMSGNIKLFFEMLFKAIDGDQDGMLDLDDLRSFGELVGDSLSDEDATQIITQSDSNKDGKVEFKEFWNWYKVQHGNINQASSEDNLNIEYPGD